MTEPAAPDRHHVPCAGAAGDTPPGPAGLVPGEREHAPAASPPGLLAAVDLDDVRRRDDGPRCGGQGPGGDRGQCPGQVSADGGGVTAGEVTDPAADRHVGQDRLSLARRPASVTTPQAVGRTPGNPVASAGESPPTGGRSPCRARRTPRIRRRRDGGPRPARRPRVPYSAAERRHRAEDLRAGPVEAAGLAPAVLHLGEVHPRVRDFAQHLAGTRPGCRHPDRFQDLRTALRPESSCAHMASLPVRSELGSKAVAHGRPGARSGPNSAAPRLT